MVYIDRGPKFECIAHGELRLADVGESIGSHDLVLHNTPAALTGKLKL